MPKHSALNFFCHSVWQCRRTGDHLTFLFGTTKLFSNSAFFGAFCCIIKTSTSLQGGYRLPLPHLNPPPPSLYFHIWRRSLMSAMSRICLLRDRNPWFAFCQSNPSVRCFKASFHLTTVETRRGNISARKFPSNPLNTSVNTCTAYSSSDSHSTFWVSYNLNNKYRLFFWTKPTVRIMETVFTLRFELNADIYEIYIIWLEMLSSSVRKCCIWMEMLRSSVRKCCIWMEMLRSSVRKCRIWMEMLSSSVWKCRIWMEMLSSSVWKCRIWMEIPSSSTRKCRIWMEMLSCSFRKCHIWSYHRGFAKESGVLGCDAVCFGLLDLENEDITILGNVANY